MADRVKDTTGRDEVLEMGDQMVEGSSVWILKSQ